MRSFALFVALQVGHLVIAAPTLFPFGRTQKRDNSGSIESSEADFYRHLLQHSVDDSKVVQMCLRLTLPNPEVHKGPRTPSIVELIPCDLFPPTSALSFSGEENAIAKLLGAGRHGESSEAGADSENRSGGEGGPGHNSSSTGGGSGSGEGSAGRISNEGSGGSRSSSGGSGGQAGNGGANSSDDGGGFEDDARALAAHTGHDGGNEGSSGGNNNGDSPGGNNSGNGSLIDVDAGIGAGTGAGELLAANSGVTVDPSNGDLPGDSTTVNVEGSVSNSTSGNQADGQCTSGTPTAITACLQASVDARSSPQPSQSSSSTSAGPMPTTAVNCSLPSNANLAVCLRGTINL